MSIDIDYLSPLPPARSGIADYSADLLPELAAFCDLRVICLPGQQPPEAVATKSASIDELGDKGRTPLYQIGNNRHHIPIWRRALEQPGIVTLHDLKLHHLLIEATLGEGDSEAYREHMVADHGWLGDTFARARRWHDLGQPAMFQIAVNRSLLRRQRGVLVHGQWAADQLLAEDPQLAVRVVPMGIPLPDPLDPAAAADWRAVRGIPDGISLLGSFGFQTPIKRTDRVIASLAEPALRNTHLLVGGEVSARIDLKQVAAEAGVAERVHFLGYLDFDEMQTAISACDLCLNLRYPTAGETSASLLRLLAIGKPVVVSDYNQFGDLPDEVCAKIPLGLDESEAQQLAATIGELLNEPEHLASMARAARKLVSTDHAPTVAAKAVVQACAEMQGLDPLNHTPARPFTPTSLLWRSLAGKLTVDGVRSPWHRGEARRLHLRLENGSLARWLGAERETGGVMIDVHWRSGPTDPPSQQRWLPLPRDLDPGDSIDLEVEIRRPIAGDRQLVIEPHLRDISGFNKVAGPSQLLEPR